MKLIPKYITTTIILTILLVLLILMGLEILISFIGQLSKIGQGNYGILQAMSFVFLDMPNQLYIFFPMASLIGSLLGLGVLANQSELIVMQAAGFSKGQITVTVLKAAMIMVVIAMILGEVVAPITENIANTNRTFALSGGQALNTGNGLWIKQNNQFININHIVNKQHLHKIISFEFNKQHKLIYAMSARSANLINGQWILTQVKQTQFLHHHIVSHAMPKKVWDIQIDTNLLGIANSDTPDDMSLIKLYSYIHYLNMNGLQSALYEMNFWKRIFQPFATAVMIFLAIPFVFGSLRSVTMGVRILIGVTIGFLFYILNQFFAPISLLYQVPPLLGACLPTLLFTLAAGIAIVMKKQ